MLPTIGTNSGSEECEFFFLKKNNDGQNHPKGDKKGAAKERPKDTQPKERKRANLSCSRKLFHPSNVTFMQIMRSNSSGMSKTSIICNVIFLSIVKVKAH